MTKPKKPQRRYVLEITFDADSPRDLEHALDAFAQGIALGHVAESGVSGGVSFSWIYRLIETPEQTPWGYREDLERWLAWDRAQKKEPAS
jgi:hypothetical protein